MRILRSMFRLIIMVLAPVSNVVINYDIYNLQNLD